MCVRVLYVCVCRILLLQLSSSSSLCITQSLLRSQAFTAGWSEPSEPVSEVLVFP
uniref:Uncharacterized protein n=1 Tax=Anguilla anguilla TaxID=7936 RepID=A0A0E9Y1A9_ANGAN